MKCKTSTCHQCYNGECLAERVEQELCLTQRNLLGRRIKYRSQKTNCIRHGVVMEISSGYCIVKFHKTIEETVLFSEIIHD